MYPPAPYPDRTASPETDAPIDGDSCSPSRSLAPEIQPSQNDLTDEIDSSIQHHGNSRTSSPFLDSQPSISKVLESDSTTSPTPADNQIDTAMPPLYPPPPFPTGGVKRSFDETLDPSDARVIGDGSRYQAPSSPLLTPLRQRQTSQSIAASHRELSKPFRSPMLSSSSRQAPLIRHHNSQSQSQAQTVSNTTTQTSEKQALTGRNPQSPLMSLKNPASASKPFRSPLATTANTASASNDRRKIQQLEKKLMTLKQAQKYQLDGSTNHLNELAQKWKNAAREAAQDLWSLAQTGMISGNTGDNSQKNDNTFGGDWESWGYKDGKEDDVLAVLKGGPSKLSQPRDSWGWDEGDTTAVDEGTAEDWNRSWEPPSPATLSSQLSKTSEGADASFKSILPDDYIPQSRHKSNAASVLPQINDEDGDIDDGEEKEENIGTMLTQLGIPKETLGWNDSEGDFVD